MRTNPNIQCLKKSLPVGSRVDKSGRNGPNGIPKRYNWSTKRMSPIMNNPYPAPFLNSNVITYFHCSPKEMLRERLLAPS